LVASKLFENRHVPTALHVNKIDGIPITGTLKPLSNNILVKVKEAVVSTTGGIFIPDNAKERPTEGKVVAIGGGRIHPETAYNLDMAVAVGDNVIYGKYDGSELKYNDINHQLIKDDDVLLKYAGDEASVDSVECVKDQVLIKLGNLIHYRIFLVMLIKIK
jgi:chaperonin GroES